MDAYNPPDQSFYTVSRVTRFPSRYGISASAAALAADLWHYHAELLHCLAVLGLHTTSECCHLPENSLTIPCGVL